MVEVPTAAGVSHATAVPLWSDMTVHEDAPPQAESCRLLPALHPIVAPPTGVTPSDASTRTIIALGAVVPTGAGGLSPRPISTMLSLAAAPSVNAFVMVLDAPLVGSVMVMFCEPSPCAGSDRIICPVLIASEVAGVLPIVAVSPGAKPVPCTATTPPPTPIRGGEIESA